MQSELLHSNNLFRGYKVRICLGPQDRDKGYTLILSPSGSTKDDEEEGLE